MLVFQNQQKGPPTWVERRKARTITKNGGYRITNPEGVDIGETKEKKV
jgi:hypothetical protein